MLIFCLHSSATLHLLTYMKLQQIKHLQAKAAKITAKLIGWIASDDRGGVVVSASIARASSGLLALSAANLRSGPALQRLSPAAVQLRQAVSNNQRDEREARRVDIEPYLKR
jgi:hypothetical protein